MAGINWADPISIGRGLIDRLPDTNTALVVLDVLLKTNWPSVESYVARTLSSRVTNWRQSGLPTDLVRRLQALLTNPVDLLDFTEAYLRTLKLPEGMISVIIRIMQNDIELQGKTASLGAHWGLTLKEAAEAGCPVLGWKD